LVALGVWGDIDSICRQDGSERGRREDLMFRRYSGMVGFDGMNGVKAKRPYQTANDKVFVIRLMLK